MDTKETILACAKDPAKLRELDPFVFEAVVAELLAGFGWEVSLTSQTRDGGYDILGVTTDRSGLQTSWVVECKRYTGKNKVDVQIARQLLGVKTHIGVPNAVILTTSSFTRDAQELSSARQDLHLIDFDKLAGWLKDYSPLPGTLHTAVHSFSSCFISHSSKDQDFVQRLAARLRQKGIHIWYAPDDIMPGDKIYDQVKDAISAFDRLLVILSVNSMKSNWVQTELSSAIAREKKEGRRIIFPIALVSIAEIQKWECFDSDAGIDIAKELRSYHIPDFSDWKNPDSFEKQLATVIKSLEAKKSSNAVKSQMKYEAPYYWQIDGDTKDGPYCQQCWDNNQKRIRLQDNHNGSWTCMTCGNTYTDTTWDDRPDNSDYNPLGISRL